MKTEYLSISNTGQLADFENKTLPSPAKNVPGLDIQTLEEVHGFKLRNRDWLEKISADVLQLPTIGSIINQPETVCANDDRVLVNPQNIPYRYICGLVITAKNGGRYLGSGFFIHQRCIITSGHCVYFNGDWAASIQVIPGQDGGNAPFGSQTSSNFRSVKGWVEQNNSEYDQGAIILPDNTLFNRVGGYFGYSELNASVLLNNSGYPGDKPRGTQWFNAGAATQITDYKLEYMIDTAGGQSGSPVYITSPARSVVGVHGYGGCPNKAVRVRDYFFQRWPEWSRL